MADATTPVEALKDGIRRFAAVRGWEPYHTPKNLAVSVSIEAAEVLELVQWKTDEEVRQDLDTDTGRHRLEEELADVLIYLVRLADVAGIDLAQATTAKIAVNRTRFTLAILPVASTKSRSGSGSGVLPLKKSSAFAASKAWRVSGRTFPAAASSARQWRIFVSLSALRMSTPSYAPMVQY